jgi:hypothetical protein
MNLEITLVEGHHKKYRFTAKVGGVPVTHSNDRKAAEDGATFFRRALEDHKAGTRDAKLRGVDVPAFEQAYKRINR